MTNMPVNQAIARIVREVAHTLTSYPSIGGNPPQTMGSGSFRRLVEPDLSRRAESIMVQPIARIDVIPCQTRSCLESTCRCRRLWHHAAQSVRPLPGP